MPNVVTKLQDAWYLARPVVLIPVWSIFFIGVITATEHPLFEPLPFTPRVWISLLFFTLLVAKIYILNQIVDRESDRINDKLFILSNNHLTPTFAWVMVLTLTLISIIGIELVLHDPLMTSLFLMALLLSLLYNLPPVQAKDRPWGGLLANLLGHGIITYYIGWYAVVGSDSLPLLVKGIGFSLSAGFANGAVYLLSTIPDVEGDRQTEKRTFAVVYGEKRTSLAAVVCVLLALGSAFVIPYNSYILWIPAAMSSLLFFVYYLKRSSKVALFFRIPVLLVVLCVSLYVPLFLVVSLSIVFFTRRYYKKRFNYHYLSFRENT